MATTHTDHWYNLTRHRPWEDWASAVIGLAVLLSPMYMTIAESAWAMNTTAIVAVLIVVLAALENVSWRRWEEVLEALCGLWLIASPFIFAYGGAQATLNMIAGGAVLILAALELWQDRNRTE